MKIPRRALVAGLSAALLLGSTGCNPAGSSSENTGPQRGGDGTAVFAGSSTDGLVDGIVGRTVATLPTKRLAAGLIPPTNKWFSGLVFGNTPQPVFPLPLSFGLTGAGFSFGLPRVKPTPKTIIGGYQPDVVVDTGAASQVVSAYDTMTVTIDARDASGQTIGRTHLAEGSPFVGYTASKAGRLTLGQPVTAADGLYTFTAGPTTYGLKVSGGSVSGTTISLDSGGTAVWFPVPQGGSLSALGALAARVTASTLSYRLEGAQTSTSLGYRTSTGQDTAFAVMPHQQDGLAKDISCNLGTYASVYGTLKVCSGTELRYTEPETQAKAGLDLSSLSGSDRTELAATLKKDIAAFPAFPADTYFGGKALYRAAMLWQLADQLHLPEAAPLKAKLTTQLLQWTDPKGCTKRPAFCFVYDPTNKGVVGLTPSFGSEQYNDHDFHYGYFLYTAGVLAKEDPALANRLAPVMNLLAADLAISGGSANFPDRRTFDAYAGHSWASGTSPFADGNNQESSSEAVNAWVGLTLWAQASGQPALETEAAWMLSTEAQSARAYWTNFDRSQPVYSGFGHAVMPLNWGGKRDYATWFSPEPAAALGILVIPMNPSSAYLAGDPARIEANVADATGTKGYNQKFGDYLLMYDALAGPDQAKAALTKARTLSNSFIDDGNSRSYLLAWLMSLQP